MLGILEAEAGTDMRDAHPALVEHLLGGKQDTICDEILRRAPCLSLYKFAEICCGEETLVREISHGREPLCPCLVTDILVEHLVKTLHDVMVYLLTYRKLAVIEPQAIVEKQLDVAHYEFTRMLVYSMVQFLLYHAEHAAVYLHLLCREMQASLLEYWKNP